MMVQYYSDRASDGGLIVGEATNISRTARGWYGAPGLYTDQQVEGWKRVVNAIHAKNGFVFAQLWHTGRSSHSDNQDGNTPASPPWTHPTGKIQTTWSPLGVRMRVALM
jgi:N-ethylmaleimide reductase